MKKIEEILAICEQLFYERSINTVGVDLLSEVLDISKTTLYKKIKTKNELIKLILVKRHSEYMQSLHAFCGDDKTIATIEKIFDWHIAWVKQDKYNGCFFLKTMVELNDNTQLLQVARQHKQQLKKFIGNRLPSGKNSATLENFLFCCIEGLINFAFYEKLTIAKLNQIKNEALRVVQLDFPVGS